MSKTEYQGCMAQKMRTMPRGVSKEARKTLFCTAAKLCSHKSSTESAARAMCSGPRPMKAAKSKGTRAVKSCPAPQRLLMRCQSQVQDLVNRGKLPKSVNPKNFCYTIFEN